MVRTKQRRMGKKEKMAIAEDTLKVIENGAYTNSRDAVVSIAEDVDHAVRATVLYNPSFNYKRAAKKVAPREGIKMHVEVTDETTLKAAQRCAEAGEDVAVLNFASAKRPGGGFLSGASAQEESLARSSALYPCIVQMTSYYADNAQSHTPLYTHNIIYSPEVPVFKRDGGDVLDQPYKVAFVTIPAVNTGVARSRGIDDATIEKEMRERMRRALQVARLREHDTYILGAFGCGVFKNDATFVARTFADLLAHEFKDAFKKVVFAVYDSTKHGTTLRAFEHAFRGFSENVSLGRVARVGSASGDSSSTGSSGDSEPRAARRRSGDDRRDDGPRESGDDGRDRERSASSGSEDAGSCSGGSDSADDPKGKREAHRGHRRR